jgi:hypothetical protein
MSLVPLRGALAPKQSRPARPNLTPWITASLALLAMTKVRLAPARP